MNADLLPWLPVPEGMCHSCRKPTVTRGMHCSSPHCPWCATCGARNRDAAQNRGAATPPTVEGGTADA